MATLSHQSPYAGALCVRRTCRRVPTTHRLVASRLETVATAVRAAARAPPNSIGQVTLSGGAVPRANVDVGALTANVLAHVAAPCRTVVTADVSEGANRARVGGGPVCIRNGGRTCSYVCSADNRPVCHGAWRRDGIGGGARGGDGARWCSDTRRRARDAQPSRARRAARWRVRYGSAVCWGCGACRVGHVAAADTSSRASRCQLRKSRAGRPAPAQKCAVIASAGA